MAETKLKLRYFFVGEDDSLNRIPLARYQRIFDRTQPITLYSGKSLKFIEARVACDKDGNEELVGASFMRHQFDEKGFWDKKEKARRMVGAMEAASVGGKGDYMVELYKAEHVEPYQWKPTSELLERLKEAIRTRKQHS